MAEVIGFVMVFGVLGLLINSLATGVVRTVALAVLAAVALIAGAPMIRQLPSVTGFFQPSQPATQSSYTVPNNSGDLSSSPATTQTNPSYPTYNNNRPYYSNNPSSSNGSSSPYRPIAGGW
ncbi:MAG TPA: hypothetical protein V6C78_15710 [Crinalium sp.]